MEETVKIRRFSTILVWVAFGDRPPPPPKGAEVAHRWSPGLPEESPRGRVVPCAVCYHASAVWQDCFYLWGGGDEEVNYSELYCLYLAALSPFFPEQQPRARLAPGGGGVAVPLNALAPQ